MLKRILATLPLCSLAGCGLFIDQLAPKNDAAAVDAAMDAPAADAGLDAFARHDTDALPDARVDLDGHMPDAFMALDAFMAADAFVPLDAFEELDALPADASLPPDASNVADASVVPDAFAARDAYTPPDSFVSDAYVPSDARASMEVCNGIDDDGDSVVDEEGCAVGGVLCRGSTFGAHAYILCDTDVTWNQADSYCTASGFHMVKIETAAENDFVKSQAMTLDWMRRGAAWEGVPRMWIGLHDVGPLVSDWRWADGSALGPAFWHPGEPGLLERCVEMRGWGSAPFTFAWNNSACGIPGRAYLCENDTP